MTGCGADEADGVFHLIFFGQMGIIVNDDKLRA
jgi:hypothetical protein